MLDARGGVTFLLGRPGGGRARRTAAAARAVTQDQQSKIQAVFASMDGDGDGAIDAKEFASALDGAGAPVSQLSQRERAEMFSDADVDDSGRIDYKEFEVWIRRTRDSLDTFRSVDTDGDGQIDYREWQRMVAALTTVPVSRDELDDVFDQLDVDGDGLVSFAEFAQWMDRPRGAGGLRGLLSKFLGLLR